MLKVLLKKQIAEVFRSYFYDAKKNRMRSKKAIAAWIIFFLVVMIGLLGGIFTGLSLSVCETLVQLDMGWLYFLLMGGIAVMLGAFGSVFNTYSGLYLAKDNDLLLSLPIPVRTIMTARLLNVWLMGSMYSAVVLVPALAVYWVKAGASVSRIICGLLLLVIVTVIVLLLSCVLGWVVAKISVRLKNRSFITVFISLFFVGAYYFFYFKANGFIREFLLNAVSYGEKIKGAARGLYLFGRIGEGDWLAAGIFTAGAGILFLLVWQVMSRTFLSIAAAGGKTGKTRYVEKQIRQKSVSGALLAKEFARFTSSAGYMLNCGLAIILIPASGVLLLVMGREILPVLTEVLSGRPDSVAVLLCAMLCLLASMNDMAAPSVSLEGKSIWIPQSLPVTPKAVLRAKTAMHLILTGIPVLFAAICAAVVVPASVPVRLLLCLTALVYTVFSALFNMVLGVRMPILNWTNETGPIKQSGAVVAAMFGGWGFGIVMGGLYMLIGYRIGAVVYLLLCILLFGAAALAMLHWLDTKGAEEFAAL